jgi:hypothetical protein
MMGCWNLSPSSGSVELLITVGVIRSTPWDRLLHPLLLFNLCDRACPCFIARPSILSFIWSYQFRLYCEAILMVVPMIKHLRPGLIAGYIINAAGTGFALPVRQGQLGCPCVVKAGAMTDDSRLLLKACHCLTLPRPGLAECSKSGDYVRFAGVTGTLSVRPDYDRPLLRMPQGLFRS